MVLIHECFGRKEVGIDETGEKEAKHGGHGVIAGIQASEWRIRQGKIERNAAGLRVGEPIWDSLLSALPKKETAAIGEASVMPSDEIRNQRTEGLACSRVTGTCGGVIHRKWRAFESFLKLC